MSTFSARGFATQLWKECMLLFVALVAIRPLDMYQYLSEVEDAPKKLGYGFITFVVCTVIFYQVAIGLEIHLIKRTGKTAWVAFPMVVVYAMILGGWLGAFSGEEALFYKKALGVVLMTRLSYVMYSVFRYSDIEGMTKKRRDGILIGTTMLVYALAAASVVVDMFANVVVYHMNSTLHTRQMKSTEMTSPHVLLYIWYVVIGDNSAFYAYMLLSLTPIDIDNPFHNSYVLVLGSILLYCNQRYVCRRTVEMGKAIAEAYADVKIDDMSSSAPLLQNKV